MIDGRPVGAVRASFGYITRRRDVDALAAMLHSLFIAPIVPSPVAATATSTADSDAPVAPTAPSTATPGASAAPTLPCTAAVAAAQSTRPPPPPPPPITLSSLFCYPIKSCRGMQATAWPLGPCGLVYAREGCVADPRGVALTQKSESRLATIVPHIVLGAATKRSAAAVATTPLPLRPPTHRNSGSGSGSSSGSADDSGLMTEWALEEGAAEHDVLVLHCSDRPETGRVVIPLLDSGDISVQGYVAPVTCSTATGRCRR